MTTGPDLTPILDDLAAGRIDAAEASRRIDAATRRDASAGVGAAPTEPAPDDLASPEAGRAIDEAAPAERAAEVLDAEIVEEPDGSVGEPLRGERVSIRTVGRRVRVVGDTSVSAVTAQGPHAMRRSNGVWEIESDGEIGAGLRDLRDVSALRTPRNLDDLLAMGLGREVVVRVNPRLEVDIETTAGALHTDGVPLLGRVRVTAGSAALTGVRRVADALLQAGSATVAGTFAAGRSRIRCESGAITLLLTRGADVSVHAATQVGRITWPGGQTATLTEYSVGTGLGRLDLDLVMGVATVTEEEA